MFAASKLFVVLYSIFFVSYNTKYSSSTAIARDTQWLVLYTILFNISVLKLVKLNKWLVYFHWLYLKNERKRYCPNRFLGNIESIIF